MVCARGLLDRVEEWRGRGTAEVSVAVEATAVWSRLFLSRYTCSRLRFNGIHKSASRLDGWFACARADHADVGRHDQTRESGAAAIDAG